MTKHPHLQTLMEEAKAEFPSTEDLMYHLSIRVWNRALKTAEQEIEPQKFLEAGFSTHSLHLKQIHNEGIQKALTTLQALRVEEE